MGPSGAMAICAHEFWVVKHYQFKFAHTSNWRKWWHREKEGTAVIHLTYQCYLQDLQQRPRRSHRWMQKQESESPLKLHSSPTCSFQSTKQIREQEKGQSAGWAGACRWNGASSYFAGWSQKQETPLGSQELSHQGRTARLEKDILEMLWCLTYFIRQPFVQHWSIYKHEL